MPLTGLLASFIQFSVAFHSPFIFSNKINPFSSDKSGREQEGKSEASGKATYACSPVVAFALFRLRSSQHHRAKKITNISRTALHLLVQCSAVDGYSYAGQAHMLLV